ncbi:MAG: hypothetical protein MUO89_09365 [Dehalococcoidia bacterium]|nr:hypothetical protein [Dehalococcoidia bacterium]
MALVALIIGILALGVGAVTTIPQIIWGKPKIKPLFTCIPYDGLICMIQNIPVEDLPYKLGVHRQDIRDLHVSFEIYDKETHKRLFFSVEYRDLHFGFDNKVGKHATLPASMTKMIVYIARIVPGADFVDFIRPGPDNIVVPLNDKGDERVVEKFEAGLYEVDLHIYIDRKRIDYIRDFAVSYNYPYASWVIDDMEKYREGLAKNAKTKSNQA